ncbi:MAG TPA: 2-oxoacid:acceptor oxidoreductase subunit alpha, partial [Acidimicrobiia bacterium]|nr:2-oxoacid:acceptor oxidoreductase subunit alpha [Acidimicrobiia bacterium]
VVEVFELTVRAFNLSERFRTPVVVLYDEIIAHTREGVLLPESVAVEERNRPTVPPEVFLPKTAEFGDVPPLPAFGDGYRFNITGLTHDERGFPTNDPDTAAALMDRLHRKIATRSEEIVDVDEYLLDDADVAVFAYGIVARAAKEAVMAARAEGVKAGLLRPKTLWPFPDTWVAETARQVSSLVVAEMNLGQMIGEVIRASEGATDIVPHLRMDGRPITPSELLQTLHLTVRPKVPL